MHEKEPTGKNWSWIGNNSEQLETEGSAIKSETTDNEIIEAFGFDKKEADMTQRLPYIISPIPMPVFGLLMYHLNKTLTLFK